MAKPPYGFFKNEDGKIVPDPDEQKTLQRIKELRDSGKSYREIASILQEEKIHAPLGGYFRFQRIERLCKERGIQPRVCFRPKQIVREYLSGFTRDGVTNLINSLVENHMEKKAK